MVVETGFVTGGGAIGVEVELFRKGFEEVGGGRVSWGLVVAALEEVVPTVKGFGAEVPDGFRKGLALT